MNNFLNSGFCSGGVVISSTPTSRHFQVELMNDACQHLQDSQKGVLWLAGSSRNKRSPGGKTKLGWMKGRHQCRSERICCWNMRLVALVVVWALVVGEDGGGVGGATSGLGSALKTRRTGGLSLVWFHPSRIKNTNVANLTEMKSSFMNGDRQYKDNFKLYLFSQLVRYYFIFT